MPARFQRLFVGFMNDDTGRQYGPCRLGFGDRKIVEEIQERANRLAPIMLPRGSSLIMRAIDAPDSDGLAIKAMKLALRKENSMKRAAHA